MSEEYRAKVFKSGNSVALRLPKALGLKEGTEMILREDKGAFTLRPADDKPRKFAIDKIWGSATDLRLIDPADRSFEERPLWNGDEADGSLK